MSTTPWDLIQRLRPDVIVKGPGYQFENMPEAFIVKEYGGRVVLLEGPPISTTEIIARIFSFSNLRRADIEMVSA